MLSDDIQEHERQIKEFQKADDKEQEAEEWFSLALTFVNEKGDPGQAIPYYEKAIEVALDAKYWRVFYAASLDLGAVYERVMSDPNHALSIFESTIKNGEPMVTLKSDGAEERETILRMISRLKQDLRK